MPSIPSELENKPVHEDVKPIEWLLGKWTADKGQGQYPSITSFTYCEQIEFSSLGQPILNYTAHSWHPVKKIAMHLETGFLRIRAGTQNLAFMVAHNFGLTTIEEGEYKDKSVTLNSTHISRMSFAKEPSVKNVTRKWTLLDIDTLEQEILMETTETPLSEHLHIIYKRVPEQK